MKLILLMTLMISVSYANDKMDTQTADFVIEIHKNDSSKYIVNTPSVCKLINEAIVVKNEGSVNKLETYPCQREESGDGKSVDNQLENISKFEGMIQSKSNEMTIWSNKILFNGL